MGIVNQLIRPPRSVLRSDPDDGAHDDIRYASADVLEWCGHNGNSSLGTGVVGGMFHRNAWALLSSFRVLSSSSNLQEKVRPPMEEEADMQVLLEK